MREVSLNDLPKYNPWVTRLLRLEHFGRQVRDLKKIEEEYNKDKYAKLLDYYRKNRGATATELRFHYIRSYMNKEICVSKGNKLFLATPDDCQRATDYILINALANPLKGANVVIEFGCGYGHNLMVLRERFPSHTFLGGEYSANAVELGNMIFSGDSNVSIKYFNFYDSEWPILEDIQGPAVVLTIQAIEQLPRARNILPIMTKYRDKIKDVIHLEPIYEMNDDTTLGLLRRAYAHISDYNLDLLSTIKEMGANIQQIEYDIYSINALNPISLIHWQF